MEEKKTVFVSSCGVETALARASARKLELNVFFPKLRVYDMPNSVLHFLHKVDTNVDILRYVLFFTMEELFIAVTLGY